MILNEEEWAPHADKPSRPHILIIDDTLDMDLARLDLRGVRVNNIFGTDHDAPIVEYAHDQASALWVLKHWKDQGITAEAVICDYKLEGPAGREEWGPQTLNLIYKQQELRPKKLFLMSKSGFRQEDAAMLDAIGARYFHSYELLYAAADTAGKEGQKQAASQRATTHLFRQWCNETLGKNYALNDYVSPNVEEVERGALPLAEVMARRGNGTQDPAVFDLLDPVSVRRAMRRHVDDSAVTAPQRMAIGKGVEGPSVSGRLAFSQEDITRIRAEHPGDPVILVLPREYLAGDNNVLLAPENSVCGVVLLDRGTQHIPVLAENLNIPVIFANREKYAQFEVRGQQLIAFDHLIERGEFAKAGDWLTLDGQRHDLLAGKHPLVAPREEERAQVQKLARAATHHAQFPWHVQGQEDMIGLRVMGNADNAADVAAVKAIEGTAGIGLVRTEHLFLEKQPMEYLQDAIFSNHPSSVRGAIQKLVQQQTDEFTEIFRHADARFPIKIRLLDAPTEEFLPNPEDDAAIAAVAQRLGVNAAEVKEKITAMRDSHQRGAAFGCAHPEIYRAQINAIFAAAQACGVRPEIMIPVLRTKKELEFLHAMVQGIAASYGMEKNYAFGVMIETQQTVINHKVLNEKEKNKAEALVQEIAKCCDFVSFGTNDLTQELLGLNRNDSDAVDAWCREHRIPHNPFEKMADRVRNVINFTCTALRAARPVGSRALEIGLCGRHAADRGAIEFCQAQRFDSISTAPSEEYLYHGLIEAGRTAILTATRERERLNQYMRQCLEYQKKIAAGTLPGSAYVPNEHIFQHATTPVIILEDDPAQQEVTQEMLERHPLVLCYSVNDALNAISAAQAKGKRPLLITDMTVTLYDLASVDCRSGMLAGADWHPLTREMNEVLKKKRIKPYQGVLLANAIAEGKIPGMTAADVLLVTNGKPPNAKNCYDEEVPLHQDVEWEEKGSRPYFKELRDFIAQRTEAHKSPPQTGRIRPKTARLVLYVDDEAVYRELFASGFNQAFEGRVSIVHTANEALEEVRKGDVSLLLTDHLMPDMTGSELVDALQAENTQITMAIVTDSQDMLERTEHNGVPIFSKMHLIDFGSNERNPLRQFIAEALGLSEGQGTHHGGLKNPNPPLHRR